MFEIRRKFKSGTSSAAANPALPALFRQTEKEADRENKRKKGGGETKRIEGGNGIK